VEATQTRIHSFLEPKCEYVLGNPMSYALCHMPYVRRGRTRDDESAPKMQANKQTRRIETMAQSAARCMRSA